MPPRGYAECAAELRPPPAAEPARGLAASAPPAPAAGVGAPAGPTRALARALRTGAGRTRAEPVRTGSPEDRDGSEIWYSVKPIAPQAAATIQKRSMILVSDHASIAKW